MASFPGEATLPRRITNDDKHYLVVSMTVWLIC